MSILRKISSVMLVGALLMSCVSCSVLNPQPGRIKADVEVNIPEEENWLTGYPEELVELTERNPETFDFVLSYYDENYHHNIDLSEYDNCGYIPHFIQWDKRWGFESYNNNFFALSGCGPTCLSMVAVYLTGDSEYSPLWMADFLETHGYAIEGVGTAWSIFDDGVQCIDLYGYQLGNQPETVTTYLMSGYPVICSMGPGDFTDVGHFVVFTGYHDGYVSILDPNSTIRSRDWLLEEISDQMVQCWAMYVGDPIADSPDYVDYSEDS